MVDEADHHVGHLNAGVVDVVLHLDRDRPGAQTRGRGVSPEDRVAQMADVRRLVRIDVGVLDDDLARRNARCRGRNARCAHRVRRGARGRGEDRCGKQSGGELRTVEEQVQIARAFDPELAHPGRQPPPGAKRRRDVARLHFQRLGEMEWGREGEVAEAATRRNLGDGVVVESELAGNLGLE